jgi:hypothetical protein
MKLIVLRKMQDNYFAFEFTDGKLEISDFYQYECRGENALSILSKLIQRMPVFFEGKRGMMSFADRPYVIPRDEQFDLAFCSTKGTGDQSSFIEMPCPYSVGWPQVGVSDGEGMMLQLLELDQEPDYLQIFWIGANTHSSRVALQNLSKANPDIIDARMMEWSDVGTIRLTSEKYVSLPDHARYKYLIDCPGNGYSGRLRWLLCTGRPVFVVGRPYVEHWHEEMVEWKHYIPVKEDLSNLLDVYHEIEKNPDLYQEISRNSKNFSRDNLLLERQLDRMQKSILERSGALTKSV